MKWLIITFHFIFAVTLLSGCSRSSKVDDSFLGGVSFSIDKTSLTTSRTSITAGGAAQLTLSARDDNGNLFYVPNSNPVVVFAATGGTSTGTFSTVVDNHDGTFSTNFNAVTAGTATTVSVTINGQTVPTTINETVTTGQLSLSLSNITLSAATVAAPSTIIATLHTLDVGGNPLPSGGLSVAFATAGGTSTGNFASVIDNNDGTYSAIFTAGVAGTATQIGATIGGSAITSSLPTVTVTAPSISIAAASANEGSALSFTISLTGASASNITIHYATADGTAQAGVNYVGASGTLTISAGATSGTINVATTDDSIYNPALTMTVSLSAPTNATISTASATGTISNIESVPVISVSAPTANEGQAETFNVSLDHASYQTITVTYATADNTAIAGTNYTNTSGTLTIAAGSTSGSITVDTQDDSVYSASALTFKLNFTSPNHATLAANSATATINNIDAQPSVQFSASTQSVNQSPSSQSITITAQLSAATNANTTVSVPLTLSGTAINGTDYNLSATSIIIAGGSTTGTVTLTAVNSASVGADKTAVLTLGTPTNASAGATSVDTVTIINNNYPTVSFSTATQDIAINQGTFTVTVNLSANPTKTVSVPILIDNSSTAVSGTDYMLTAPTLTFASGTTTQTFTVTVLDQLSPAVANAAIVLKLGALTNGSAGGTTTQTDTIASPSLDLNFSAMYNPSQQMSQAPYNQLNYSRNSTGTYIDCDGLVKTASPNVPRIDCNGSTGQPNGLLVESASTNIINYSGNLTSSSWGYNGGTAVASTVPAPDGTFSTTLITGGFLSQNKTISNDSTSWTCSAFIKKSTGTTSPYIQLNFWGGSTPIGPSAYFSWGSNTIAAPTGEVGATSSSVALGNGWYRISVSGANNSTGNTTASCYLAPGTNVFAWGVQMENTSYVTSYIPTLATAVSRVADTVSSASIGSWYSSAQSTMYAEGQLYNYNNGYPTFFNISDGTANNYIDLFFVGPFPRLRHTIISGGVTQADSFANFYGYSTGVAKLAMGFSPTSFSADANNATPLTLSSIVMPSVNRVDIGTSFTSGVVTRATYFKKNLSSTTVKAFTDTTKTFRSYSPTVNLTFNAQTVIEPQQTVYVTAALNEPATGTITVPYLVGGTAILGQNYSGLTNGNFVFLAGQSRSTISFTLIDDGSSTSPTITVNLGAATGVTLGINNAQTITIQRPSLDLNYAAIFNPAVQSAIAPFNALSLARASTATYTDCDGLIKTVGSNILRVDCNPTTNQPNGVLIEQAATNLLLHSSNLSGWIISAGSTALSGRALDGTLSTLYTEDGSTNIHDFVWNPTTITAGATYVFSVYLKYNGQRYVELNSDNNAANGVMVVYDLVNGVVSNSFASGTSTVISASISPQSNGWYRCIEVVKLAPTDTNMRNAIVFVPSSSTSWYPSFAGNGTSGVYAWGAQLENGTFATSYIPTTTAAVTRQADVLSTTNLSWFNSTLGSFSVSGTTEYASAPLNSGWFEMNANATNRFELFSPTSNIMNFENINAGTNIAVSANAFTFNAMNRYAVDYSNLDYATANSGFLVGVSNSPTVPSGLSTFTLGSGQNLATLNGTIARLTYYPKRISNQDLAILSSPAQYSPRAITPVVTFTTPSQYVIKNEGAIYVLAALSDATSATVTVPYTLSGTAVSTTDYTGVIAGTLTFAPGTTRALLSFNAVNNIGTGDKTLIFTLGAATNATIAGATNTAETIYLIDSTNGIVLNSAAQANANNTVTYTGNCIPGSTINVTGAQTSSTTCLANGTFSWTSSSITSDGNYSFTFTETDSFSNSSSVAGTYNRDTVAPAAVTNFVDGNVTTSSTSSPVMTWTASTDSGGTASGISYYAIAIGTSLGGTDVLSWTNVGNVTTYQITSGLSLTNGNTYYASIKAIDVAGNSSSVTQGDGFAVVTDTPPINLNFMSGVLPPAVQFSNASGANIAAPRYYNSAGILTPAPENLILYSQDFTQSANWSAQTGIAASASNVAAPDGTVTGSLLTISSAPLYGTGFLQGVTIPTTSQTYVLSAYVKLGSTVCSSGTGFIQLNMLNGTSQSGRANYTLSGAGSIYGSGSPGPSSTQIINVGNGWYRVSMVIANTGGNNTGFVYVYPSVVQGESCNAYVWGVQLEANTSPSSYIYTTSAPAYGPRFDYNPTTLSRNGLLIEESRTNIVSTASSDFTATGCANCTLSTNAATAPDGTTTATKLIENTANSRHYTDKSATIVAGAAYTYSAFVKAGARDHVWFCGGKSSNPYTRGCITANLTNGTFVNTNSGAPTSVTGQLVQALPNGWYRIAVTVIIDGSSTDGYMEINAALSNGTYTYAGDGSSGYYIWGAQIEAGNSMSSYIPTTSATAVTRSADIVSVNGLSSVNNSQGTLLTAAMAGLLFDNSVINLQQVAASLEASYNDRISIRRNPGTNSAADAQMSAINFVAGNSYPSTTAADNSWSLLTTQTVALAYQSSNSAVACSGAVCGTSSSSYTPFIPTQLSIGHSAYYGTYWNGWIQSLQYYNTRLSNSAIQGLTHP